MSNCLVLWCSGYHICFTRRRSPVRSRAGSVKLFCIPSISIQCYNANIYFHRRLHCVHCDIKSKPDCNWLALTLRTKCHLIWTCLWWYTHFTLQWPISVGDVAQMVERSLSMWEVGGSIPPVSKKCFAPASILLATDALFKSQECWLVLWCSGYHICFTRRRSPVRSWAGSDDVLLFSANNCENDNIFKLSVGMILILPKYVLPLSTWICTLWPSPALCGSFPFNSKGVSTTCPTCAFSQCSSLSGMFHKIAFTNLKSSIV